MSASLPIVAVVTYRFNATPEAVFDAWVTSDKVRRWFGPGLGEMVRVAIDPRKGGQFSFVQRRGLDNVDHIGTYLAFDRPTRLEFTWQVKGTDHSSLVTVDIAPSASGADLKLEHQLHPHWADYRERTEGAWTKMLSAMAEAIKAA